jgi:hypothetical protein
MDVKPGIKTTEFVIAIIGSVLMVGVTAGFWTNADVQAFVQALTEAAQSVAVLAATATPLIGAAVMVWKYISSRTELKKK